MAEPLRSEGTQPKADAKPKVKPATRKVAPSAIAKRLAALRKQAATRPAQAQAATWEWIEELGEQRDGDALEELFSLGTPPEGLDGPTDGILVCTLTNPLVDVPVRLLTSAWMPWQGKSFDAAASRGVNRMTDSSRLPAKALWPQYGMRETEDGRVAFDFETGVEPGMIDPKVDVLKIDYADIAPNPELIIRQIRDELVTLVPDTHLGRILFRLPRGRFSNIGYFALRQPAGGS
jgi:hypothetical protein